MEDLCKDSLMELPCKTIPCSPHSLQVPYPKSGSSSGVYRVSGPYAWRPYVSIPTLALGSPEALEACYHRIPMAVVGPGTPEGGGALWKRLFSQGIGYLLQSFSLGVGGG